LSAGGPTEGSDAESKDPEDLFRAMTLQGVLPRHSVFGFQFWQSLATGVPSIKAKVLSRQNCPWRCVSITMLAREVDDEGSGKHLFLNHPLVEGFAFAVACRSTNHRFGPTATMILLFEHPTSCRVRERPIKHSTGD
jgi:hypothetical protein